MNNMLHFAAHSEPVEGFSFNTFSFFSGTLFNDGERLPLNRKTSGMVGESQIETRPPPFSTGLTQLMRKLSCLRSLMVIATFR